MPKFTPKPGYTFTPGPPPEALAYFRAKGLRPAFDYRDVWREEHAAAFTVAKMTELDLLSDVRDSLTRAMQEGTPFQKWKRELRPELEKRGWWGIREMTDPKTGKTRPVQLGSPRRLRTIFHANMRTAFAAGRWERIQRTKASHPFLQYRLGPSLEHRRQHTAWQGLILPADAAFWASHYPPNGWGCKCYVRQLTARETTRRGGPSKSPPIKKRAWKNKRTGKTEMVPVGIDPGWDTNPGIARKENVDRLLAGKLEEADPMLAQVAIRTLMAQGFRNFLENPKGFFPVLRLSDEAAAAIGAERKVAVLSAETLEKNRRRHPDLALEDYLQLPELGETPTVIVRDQENTVVIVKRGRHIYRAAVKAAQRGERETFVTTFHRTTHRQTRRLLKTGKALFGKWE